MAMIDTSTRRSTRVAAEPASPGLTIRVRPAAYGLAGTAGALAFAHLAVHALAGVGLLSYEGRLTGAFDMDSEASIPTWFSMALLLTIATMLAGTALATPQRRDRPGWYVLAAVFAYLSIDEGAALHESLMYATRNLLGITGGPLWYAWVIPVGIALAVATPFALRFVRRLPKLTQRLFVLAGVLYVGGALGIEIISATAGSEVESLLRDPHDPAVWLLACFEEGLEMAGLVVMAVAVLLHLRNHALAGREFALRVG